MDRQQARRHKRLPAPAPRPRLRELRAYLEKHGPCERKKLIESAGIPHGTLNDLLREENGFAKDAKGRWYVRSESVSNGETEDATATPRNMTGFVASLTDGTRAIVTALVNATGGITTPELAAATGLETTALPSIIRSLRLQSVGHGFGEEGILTRSQPAGGRSGGRRPVSLYAINPDIREELKRAINHQ